MGTGSPPDELCRNRAIIQCPHCGDWYYQCFGHVCHGAAPFKSGSVYPVTNVYVTPDGKTLQQVVPPVPLGDGEALRNDEPAEQREPLPSTTDDARYKRGIPWYEPIEEALKRIEGKVDMLISHITRENL